MYPKTNGLGSYTTSSKCWQCRIEYEWNNEKIHSTFKFEQNCQIIFHKVMLPYGMHMNPDLLRNYKADPFNFVLLLY